MGRQTAVLPLSQFCVKRAHQISAAWLISAVSITSSKQLCICMCAGNCNGDSECRDDFYSDPVAVGYYKDHVRRILNRVNTFNGRLYRQVFRLKTWPICETGDEELSAVLHTLLTRNACDTSNIMLLYQKPLTGILEESEWAGHGLHYTERKCLLVIAL